MKEEPSAAKKEPSAAKKEPSARNEQLGVRTIAARVLAEVHAGKNLESALSDHRGREDRARLFDLCFGTVRHYFSLAERVDSHLQHPLKPRDQDVRWLMLVGAYQLQYAHVPAHAAVSETVQSTRELGKPWAAALVNAILRKCVPPGQARSRAARLETPDWLADALEAAYPESWREIIEASNSRAPLTLRVNRRKVSRSEVIESLTAQGIQAHEGASDDAITLAHPQGVETLPGFAEGWFSAQDEASQIATTLLDITPGARILDACAAPGNKSAHLLERHDDIELVSIDIAPSRTSLTQRDAARLGVPLEITEGDATDLEWWDTRPFDCILVDAPCSATGTLRRHPDIKLHRTPAQVRAASELQAAILSNLWQTLAPGGTLLYCTCSTLPAENDTVVRDFLTATSGVEIDRVDIPFGQPTPFGRQLLPTLGGHDGFYYSRLIKAHG